MQSISNSIAENEIDKMSEMSVTKISNLFFSFIRIGINALL